MNNRLVTYLLRCLLCCLCLFPVTVNADIVYPARLDLREIEPGTFEVNFVLPVINGKVLKASPVFPEFCSMTGKKEISGNPYVKEARWRIQCNPQALYGKSIGISGLQGSQVTIILTITTLEGRSYTSNLHPASAYFEIPYPPTPIELLKHGILEGSRIPLSNLIFGVLLFSFILRKPDQYLKVIAVISTSVITGYLLGYLEWLKPPGWIFEITALLFSFILIISKYFPKNRGITLSSFGMPLAVSLIFLGGEHADTLNTSGMTKGENGAMMIFTLTGILLGVALYYALVKQGLFLLVSFTRKNKLPENNLTIITGAIVLGLLLYYSSLLWNTPSLLPPIPKLLWPVMLMSLMILANLRMARKRFPLFQFYLLYFTGIASGFLGLRIPFNTEVTLAVGLLILICLIFQALNNRLTPLLLTAVLAFSTGVWIAGYTNNHLSFPVARAVEFSLVLYFIGGISFPFIKVLMRESKTPFIHRPIPIAFVIFTAFLITYNQFSISGFRIGNPGSTSELHFPLLSLILIISGIVLWPKRKKVHKDLGLPLRKPLIPLLLFGVALCVLPIRTGLKNPWFNPSKMDRAYVQSVIQNVLTNTYTAFNLADEEKLYEALSRNVDEELLDNIYLDSRRRLTMGLREGAEVTVEDVHVDILDEPQVNIPELPMSYAATWTVTARVKHLRHIHYRRNRYTGTIEMKSTNESWKISKIILNSEEREVIPSATL